MMMIANYIVYGVAAANNKNATENKETMTRQNIISTILAIISGILWSCFMYYWHWFTIMKTNEEVIKLTNKELM